MLYILNYRIINETSLNLQINQTIKYIMNKFMNELLDIPLKEVLPLIQVGIMEHTKYFGVKTLKCPMDAWVYQELLFELKPDVIIEIGNAFGGSALLLAHQCDLMNHGHIIGIDITHDNIDSTAKAHPRITFIEGDACKLFDQVKRMIPPDKTVLIIEDSSHTFENTLNVLSVYSELLKPGDYFIIEDSICHHGLDHGPNPGPFEAIETFLLKNSTFVSDRSREKFLITWNPKGFLKKIAH